jgi:molybdopterin molybdotransferase
LTLPRHRENVLRMNTPEPLPDCYEGDPDLLPPGEATRRIRAHVRPVNATETVAVIDTLGRVAARDVVSPMDVPGHTNSAMDGYACAGDSLPDGAPRWYEVAGTAYAGKPFAGPVGPSQAVRIMTGAVMPDGADTVVMQEHVEVDSSRVRIPPGVKAGQHVRQAGEDIAAGAVVVPRGRRVMPAEMGLLASLGVAEIEVYRTLRVAYFSTGDEIRSPGAPFEPGLVYDSNRFTMHGMLGRLGVEIVDLGIVPDRRDAVLDAFREASARADIVLSSGGASTGEADYVKEALGELGQVGFWRIAIRPGRPLAFGLLGDSVFFGLPGNPVAVMVTFYQFVEPAIRAASGEADTRPRPAMEARCTTRLRKKPGRIEYYRAVLDRDESGALVVRSTGKSGSGLLHTMSDANCFIVLPEGGATVEPGAMVAVQPFFGLM